MRDRLPVRVVFVLVLAYVSLPAQAGARHELENLRRQEAALQRGLDRTLRDRSQALDALRLSEDHVATVGRKVALTKIREQHLEVRIAALQGKETQLRQAQTSERKRLARQAVAAYVAGRADAAQLFFSQGDARLAGRMLVYYRYILRSRARRLNAARQTLTAIRATAAATRAEVDQLRAAAQSARLEEKALETALHRRAEIVSSLTGRAHSGRQRLTALRARAQRLQTLLRGLRSLPRVPEHIPNLRGPFAKFRGRLPLPIPAQFAEVRAAAAHGSGRWAGVVIPGVPGEDVRAVFPGRVVYANWLRGYGLLLILQNGGGYMTLYGHNQTLFKRVGDFVRGGEVIATVGNSGGFARPGLYFELSHNGQPLDPLVWLAH